MARMPRIPIIAAAGALFLTGCAPLPSQWHRADGLPAAAEQVELARTACHGELTKSLIDARDRPYGNDLVGYQGVQIDIYRGCMAQYGYLTDSK